MEAARECDFCGAPMALDALSCEYCGCKLSEAELYTPEQRARMVGEFGVRGRAYLMVTMTVAAGLYVVGWTLEDTR